MAGSGQTTIIKRVEENHGDGHHGGAWKVAYADFMTAMMAFFLLLWILSSADEQKLKGIAEYFTDATEPGGLGVLDGASLGPPGTLTASNGSILARGSELGDQNQTVVAKWEVRDVTPPADGTEPTAQGVESDFPAPEDASGFDITVSRNAAGMTAGEGLSLEAIAANDPNSVETSGKPGDGGAAEAVKAQDDQRFEELQNELTQAMQENPELRPLMENIIFEQTERGLRIQVIDQEGRPMFARGSADMLEATRQLLSKLGESLSTLPNPMVITGHTDAVPFSSRANYDNWDLSTDRANATRRMLLGAGVERERLLRVSGKAYTDPLVPERPDDPSNRRITLMLQYSTVEPEAPAEVTAENTAPLEGASSTPNEPSAERAQQVPAEDGTVLDQRSLENLRSVLR